METITRCIGCIQVLLFNQGKLAQAIIGLTVFGCGFITSFPVLASTIEDIIATYYQKQPSRVIEELNQLEARTYQNFSPDMLIKASYAAATTANTDLAILLTDILIVRALQLDDATLTGQAHYNRGAAYAYAGKHDLALDSFLLALNSFESVQSVENIARIKGALALIYVEIQEYELAKPYFEEALIAHKALNDKANITKVYANRGFLNLQLGNYEDAGQDLERALQLAKELDYKSTLPTLYKNLGILQAEAGESRLAFEYFNESLHQAKVNNLEYHAGEILREIARLEIKLGEFERARKNLLQSIEISERHGLLKQVRNSYFLLAELEATQKNYEAAYFAKEQALTTSEEMGESRIAGNLSRLDRYTTRIKEENKRLALEQENKIAMLAAEREELLKNFSIVIAVIASIFAVYFIRRFSYSNKQAIIYEKQSKIDPLTEVWNRRAGEAKLARLIAREKLASSTFSIAMLDIDYFKQVNDNFGHDVGDRVIIAVCNLIQESLRPSDMLCRWGGEEFIIIWDDCNSCKAFDVCERIRKKINSTVIEPAGQLTVSIGISMYENDDIYELIKRGDQALYHAKHSGRNRVFVKDKTQQNFLGVES